MKFSIPDNTNQAVLRALANRQVEYQERADKAYRHGETQACRVWMSMATAYENLAGAFLLRRLGLEEQAAASVDKAQRLLQSARKWADEAE